MISDWQTSIADADMADWVTVAAYLLAALLSARAARHAGLRRQARDSMFWRITAVLLVLLGINELLDLQTLLTSIGRAHAKANGWYGEHRRAQHIFVIALGLAAVFAGICMLWLTRRTHASVRLALVGLVFIGLFVSPACGVVPPPGRNSGSRSASVQLGFGAGNGRNLGSGGGGGALHPQASKKALSGGALPDSCDARFAPAKTISGVQNLMSVNDPKRTLGALAVA